VSTPLRWALLLLAVPALGACYTYQPLAGPVAPGMRVRAHLTTEGAVRQSEITGEPRRVMDGTVEAVENGSVTIEIHFGRNVGGFTRGGEGLTQSVQIPRDQLEGLDERRLSKSRTVLLALGIGTTVGVALQQAIAGGGGGQGTKPPDTRPPTALIVPLLKFRIPIPVP